MKKTLFFNNITIKDNYLSRIFQVIHHKEVIKWFWLHACEHVELVDRY